MSKAERPRRGGSYIRRDDGALHRLSPEEEREMALARPRATFADAVDEYLKDERFSAAAVFARMKAALSLGSDAELAWVLGISPQALWNRKKRNAVPYREAMFLARWANVSLDYLLSGAGPPRGAEGAQWGGPE